MTTFPFSFLMMICGWYFSSGDSVMTWRTRPVFSSRSSLTVTPSMMSLNDDGAAELGQDGEGVRIPFHQHLAGLDFLAFLDLEHGAVRDGVALLFASGFIGDDQRAVPVHNHQVPIAVGHVLDIEELHDAVVLGFFGGLFMSPARGAADVEGSHRQLGAGLADRLGGDDADRLAQIHQFARWPDCGRST